MDFSRGGDLIVLPISNYFSVFLVCFNSRDLFDTVRASVGTLINKSGVKMTQNAPEQMFLLGTYCSCLLPLLLFLFYYTLTLHLPAITPFLTVIHCFRKDYYLMLVIIIYNIHICSIADNCLDCHERHPHYRLNQDCFKNLHHHFFPSSPLFCECS